MAENKKEAQNSENIFENSNSLIKKSKGEKQKINLLERVVVEKDGTQMKTHPLNVQHLEKKGWKLKK